MYLFRFTGHFKIYLFFVARKPALQLYLKPGHKIGKPVPLFEKIEQSRLEELKKRYGGSQENSKQNTEQNLNIQSIEDAEKAVAAQGQKVRELKASKSEKVVIQKEVKTLLDLKKVLENLQKK